MQSENWMQTKHINRYKQDKFLHAKDPNDLIPSSLGTKNMSLISLPQNSHKQIDQK
jgi:hypothetical protein